jgi:bacteriocin-like protein
MKKAAAKQKLKLEVETLRTLKTLNDQELKHVAGGLTTWISQCCAH